MRARGILPEYTGTLLPEHLALITKVREHRERLGRCTERCDRPAAEAAVRWAYTTAGLSEPAQVIWRDSPLGGVVAAAGFAQSRAGSAGSILGRFGAGPDGEQLRDRLDAHLVERLRSPLARRLRSQAADQLWDMLDDPLDGVVAAQLLGELGGQVVLGGQIDPWSESFWLACYTATLSIAGPPANDRFTALTAAMDSVGWWWPMREAVVLTERPTEVHLESIAGRARLHCESGPAVGYADGYGLWAWHGVRVPRDLVDTGWDAGRILREPNVEVRRCAIERMGWDEFVIAAGLQQVGGTVPDPGNPGNHLSLFDVPERIYGEVGVRVLLCTNGTPERDGTIRRFGLTVPAEIGDPLEAAGWGYGLTAEEYSRAERRT
jgi:hypothetical protein